jgi:hypothetical protein
VNTNTGAMASSNTLQYKMHEVSTRSIIQTSALLNQGKPASSQQPKKVLTSVQKSNTPTALTLLRIDDASKENVEQIELARLVQIVSPLSEEVEMGEDNEMHGRLNRFKDFREDVPLRTISVVHDEDEERIKRHDVEYDALLLEQSIRNQVRILQVDLSEEQARRQRSERNLVKLAKELKRRAVEADLKDQKIVQMSLLLNEFSEKLDKHQQLILSEKQTYCTLALEGEKRVVALKTTNEGLRHELLVFQAIQQESDFPLEMAILVTTVAISLMLIMIMIFSSS